MDKKAKSTKWTQDEIEELRSLWHNCEISIADISKQFQRSEKTIKNMACQLKLGSRNQYKYTPWTIDEIEILKDLWHDFDISILDISKKINRSERAIKDKARELELGTRKPNTKLWTSHEVGILKEMWDDCDVSVLDISEKLNRSERAIIQKAYQLNLGTREENNAIWKSNEIVTLKEMWDDCNVNILDICEKLNRSEIAVKEKAKKLKLGAKANKKEKHRKRNTIWTEDEIKNLEDWWYDCDISVAAMSKRLQRSENAIKEKAYQLNLGARERDYEKLTVRDIYEGMAITNDIVYRWIKKGLRTRSSKTGRKSTRMINVDDFLKFLQDNPQCYNAKNITKEFMFFLGYPQFLVDRQKEDKEINMDNHFKLWTNEEDKKLDQLFKMGLSNKKIAEKMSRSETAIKYHLMDLSLTRGSYNQYEIDILKANADKMTTKELAKLLPLRTEGGVIAKCKELGIKYHMSEKTLNNNK